MTQGELITEAPANIVFPGTADPARVAQHIGEELLRPFGVELARAEIRAQANPFWGTARPASLSVTAVGTDGTQVTRYSANASWPHEQPAITALEHAISSGQATWTDSVASYTLTLQGVPERPGVFRHGSHQHHS